jgi:hypothetical protein
MTKQEIIKQAYGKYYPQLERCLDENGWSNNWNHFISVESRIFQPEEIEKNGKCWRPKSLEGLEDNNGWIKIESVEDLPNGEYALYHVISKNDIYCDKPKNQGIEEFWGNDIQKKEYWLKEFSHYKPIEKPKPPIY